MQNIPYAGPPVHPLLMLGTGDQEPACKTYCTLCCWPVMLDLYESAGVSISVSWVFSSNGVVYFVHLWQWLRHLYYIPARFSAPQWKMKPYPCRHGMERLSIENGLAWRCKSGSTPPLMFYAHTGHSLIMHNGGTVPRHGLFFDDVDKLKCAADGCIRIWPIRTLEMSDF